MIDKIKAEIEEFEGSYQDNDKADRTIPALQDRAVLRSLGRCLKWVEELLQDLRNKSQDGYCSIDEVEKAFHGVKSAQTALHKVPTTSITSPPANNPQQSSPSGKQESTSNEGLDTSDSNLSTLASVDSQSHISQDISNSHVSEGSVCKTESSETSDIHKKQEERTEDLDEQIKKEIDKDYSSS